MATPQTRAAGCPAGGHSVRRPAAGLLLTALAILGLAGGCAPPGHGAAGTPGRLYALNALDGTLTPLDGERLAGAGPPLPAGAAPVQAAPGPGGSVLVLSAARDGPGALTHVARDRGGWRARPVPLDTPLRQASLAADGGPYAAVAHHLPTRLPPEAVGPSSPAGAPEGACRLTLLDLVAGGARTHAVCAAGEHVAGLALGAAPEGPVAYLGIWDARDPQAVPEADPAPAPPGWSGGAVPRRLRHRVVTLDARTGRVLAARALATPPEHLQLVAGPTGSGRPDGRLYVLEGAPGAESEHTPLGRWRLLGLHPATLETEQEAVLGVRASALAVAPDGGHAYALAAGGKDVLHLDLATGVTRQLGALPGYASGTVAVTAGHVLAPNPLGSEVWALDRRDGRLAAAVPVGRRPVAVLPAGLRG